jgi:ElaB/YqjD/DUF883 family membrane-anchored ribosome-binding protein
MLSSTMIEENWDQLRETIRQKWSQFSEAELEQFNGDVDDLVARIQRKTGASRESIQEFLQAASQKGTSMMNRMKDQVSGTVAGARETASNVAEQARHGYEQMQSRVGDTVHDHPGMTVAAAFGLGILAGIGLSLLLFEHEPERTSWKYSREARKAGRKFWDSIAENLPDSIARRV